MGLCDIIISINTIKAGEILNKILIIEDDKIISKSIANHLTKWDFVVEKIKDFKNIMEEFIEFDPHLKKL